MRRYLIHLSYLGSNFKGMQKQCESCPTVQSTVEASFAKYLYPQSVFAPNLTISSRTDSGVHALSTTGHIDLIHPNDGVYNMEQVIRFMNSDFYRNGHEVRINSCEEVSKDFHARHAAISRSYLYRFMTQKKEGPTDIPVIELNRCYAVRGVPFDVERVKNGMHLFLGMRDFQTFSGKIRNNYMNAEVIYTRKLHYFTFEKGQPLMPDDPFTENFDYWNIRCGAKAFLYHQVRRMVGALISLGLGKVTEKDIRVMLEVPSRHSWHPYVVPAPAHGLYLCHVKYDPLYLKKHIDSNLISEHIHYSLGMSLCSLLAAKKTNLKHRSTILTNMLGEKYEILDGEMRLIDKGEPFVVDTKPDLQIALVDQGLYFGSQDPAVSIDLLQEYKIMHVISIGVNLDTKFEGISYYFIDLLDLPECSISKALKTCLSIIKTNRGENVFIHCNAGVSRSASVVIAYLIVTNNLTYERAYERVKSVRECIKPNDGFVKQLRSLKPSDFATADWN